MQKLVAASAHLKYAHIRCIIYFILYPKLFVFSSGGSIIKRLLSIFFRKVKSRNYGKRMFDSIKEILRKCQVGLNFRSFENRTQDYSVRDTAMHYENMSRTIKVPYRCSTATFAGNVDGLSYCLIPISCCSCTACS